MITWINDFARKCVIKEYITEDHAPVLVYELECRYVRLVVGIPFFILGSVISSLLVVISFFIGFYFLQERIGGFHAKNVKKCLFATLISELLILGLMYRVLSNDFLLILLLISTAMILCFPPYQDSNIGFTDEELRACATSGKIRMISLLVVLVILCKFGYMDLARGMTLGVVLAAVLLAFAYINQIMKEHIKWKSITQNRKKSSKRW